MQVIRATVCNGRIVVDEPTSLPEGHEVQLRVANDDGMAEDSGSACTHRSRAACATVAPGASKSWIASWIS